MEQKEKKIEGEKREKLFLRFEPTVLGDKFLFAFIPSLLPFVAIFFCVCSRNDLGAPRVLGNDLGVAASPTRALRVRVGPLNTGTRRMIFVGMSLIKY